MNTPLTAEQHELLDAVLYLEIARLENCRKLLCHLDQEVLAAGLRAFGTEIGFTHWAVEPAVGLNGQIPLKVTRTAKGRKQVAGLLSAIAHGLF